MTIGQVVVYHRGHRGDGRRLITHIEQGGGLTGVFISVTTVPAAGNIALGAAFGVGSAIWGSTLQLLVNVSGMALAGWAALAIQQAVWSRVSVRRAKAMMRPKRML